MCPHDLPTYFSLHSFIPFPSPSFILESDTEQKPWNGLCGSVCPMISMSLITPTHLGVGYNPHTPWKSPLILETISPGIFWKHCLLPALWILSFHLPASGWRVSILGSVLPELPLDWFFKLFICRPHFYSVSHNFRNQVLLSTAWVWLLESQLDTALKSPFWLAGGIQIVLDYVPANRLFAIQVYSVLWTPCLLHLFITLIFLASWSA